MSWKREFDELLPGEGAETLGSQLFARDDENTELGIGCHWAEQRPTVTDAYEDLDTFNIFMPPYVLSGDIAWFVVRASGGGGSTKEHKLRVTGDDGTTSATGTEILIDNGSGVYAYDELSVTVQASWLSSWVAFTLEGYENSAAGAGALNAGQERVALGLYFVRT